MKIEVIRKIEEQLDPRGILIEEIQAGRINDDNVEKQARQYVISLNRSFKDEGGSGITVAEMAEYMRGVIAWEREQEES